MSLIIVTPATVEPVTLDECHAHLNLTTTGSPPEHPDDGVIALFLSAAREWAENFTGRTLAETEYELRLDAFPSGGIELPRGPVISVDAITYEDGDGADVTLDEAGYWSDDDPSYPQVHALPRWPSATNVRVDYTAGYEAVPASIKAAILLVLGHLYENREDSAMVALQHIPMGAEALLRPYRIRMGMA